MSKAISLSNLELSLEESKHQVVQLLNKTETEQSKVSLCYYVCRWSHSRRVKDLESTCERHGANSLWISDCDRSSIFVSYVETGKWLNLIWLGTCLSACLASRCLFIRSPAIVTLTIARWFLVGKANSLSCSIAVLTIDERWWEPWWNVLRCIHRRWSLVASRPCFFVTWEPYALERFMLLSNLFVRPRIGNLYALWM